MPSRNSDSVRRSIYHKLPSLAARAPERAPYSRISWEGTPKGRKNKIIRDRFDVSRRDFLPRGSGIVTRRPLVLQLNHSRSGSVSPPPSLSSGLLFDSFGIFFRVRGIFALQREEVHRFYGRSKRNRRGDGSRNGIE